MRLVQVTLTDELAGLLAASADITLKAHAADQIVTLTDEEQTEYQRLAVFMAAVASEPQNFPVRGTMARSIKAKVRAMKGPAQIQGKPKKRSQGQQKRDRVARREAVAEYNAAQEKLEAERTEREAFIARRQVEIQSEPKFDITDIAGNVILAGVPQSMVKAVDAEGIPGAVTSSEVSRVLQLPTSVERQMEREHVG